MKIIIFFLFFLIQIITAAKPGYKRTVINNGNSYEWKYQLDCQEHCIFPNENNQYVFYSEHFQQASNWPENNVYVQLNHSIIRLDYHSILNE